MTLTDKHRKLFWIGIGLVVAFYVVRSMANAAQQAAYYQQVIQHQQAALRQQQNVLDQLRAKPKEDCKAEPVKALQGAQAIPAAPPAAPATGLLLQNPAPSPFAKVSGIWAGQVGLLDRGLCWLRLEIKPDIAIPGRFTGISAIKCQPYGQLVQRNAKAENLNAINPESAIISGTEKDGALQLQVDKVTQTDAHGCAPDSFVVTPFGLNRFAVEWTEDKCAGGRAILARAIR
jgi:hypothetical protein